MSHSPLLFEYMLLSSSPPWEHTQIKHINAGGVRSHVQLQRNKDVSRATTIIAVFFFPELTTIAVYNLKQANT